MVKILKQTNDQHYIIYVGNIYNTNDFNNFNSRFLETIEELEFILGRKSNHIVSYAQKKNCCNIYFNNSPQFYFAFLGLNFDGTERSKLGTFTDKEFQTIKIIKELNTISNNERKGIQLTKEQLDLKEKYNMDELIKEAKFKVEIVQPDCTKETEIKNRLLRLLNKKNNKHLAYCNNLLHTIQSKYDTQLEFTPTMVIEDPIVPLFGVKYEDGYYYENQKGSKGFETRDCRILLTNCSMKFSVTQDMLDQIKLYYSSFNTAKPEKQRKRGKGKGKKKNNNNNVKTYPLVELDKNNKIQIIYKNPEDGYVALIIAKGLKIGNKYYNTFYALK